MNKITLTLESLYLRVSSLINNARNNVERSINHEMVRTYFLIGKEIVEEEQKGKERAEYGEQILQKLSIKLQNEYQKGFGVDTLERARRFYLIYQSDVLDTSEEKISAPLERKSLLPHFNPDLSWSHYRELIKISRADARKFYEIEAAKNNWSRRELERQIASLLFERLSLSKDKDGVMELGLVGQEIKTASDAIKDPMVLEFLGLPESHLLVESNLEQALIDNLQNFLLELGKGFAFVARQKRLTLEGDHFYADLVFYHVILKSYIIVELKTNKLTHTDLGQIQLYVNYFDQEIKQPDDNPTIGLILCSKKNDAVVKYTLGDKASQIFASKYKFHLPTEAELEEELKREVKMLKNSINDKS